MKYLEVCCDQFREAFEKADIFTIMENYPFEPSLEIEPTVFAMSDGGHGGFAQLNYCPFCGRQFRVAEIFDTFKIQNTKDLP